MWGNICLGTKVKGPTAPYHSTRDDSPGLVLSEGWQSTTGKSLPGKSVQDWQDPQG